MKWIRCLPFLVPVLLLGLASTPAAGPLVAFPQGVASGDVTSSRAILSTRDNRQQEPSRAVANHDDSAPEPSPKNFYGFRLGAVYWENLGDIEPALSLSAPEKFGRFQDWGFNMEMSYHRHVARWGTVDLLLGMDAGLFYHGNEKSFAVTIQPSGKKIEGELVARGLYVTPSAKLLKGKPDSWRFFLGAGLGYYLVDFVEQFSDGFVSNEFFSEDALGGYVSVGVCHPLSRSRKGWLLCVEDKLHFVNFGDLERFAPGAGDLSGPINILQVGIVWMH